MDCPICGMEVDGDDKLQVESMHLELETVCLLWYKKHLSLIYGREVDTKKFVEDYFKKTDTI